MSKLKNYKKRLPSVSKRTSAQPDKITSECSGNKNKTSQKRSKTLTLNSTATSPRLLTDLRRFEFRWRWKNLLNHKLRNKTYLMTNMEKKKQNSLKVMMKKKRKVS